MTSSIEKSEAAIQQEIRLWLSQKGITTWRNNVGAARTDTGRIVRYGLANDSKQLQSHFKSSDLIGILPDGRFLAIEVKRRGGRRLPAQENFIKFVNSHGGVACFAESVQEVEECLKRNHALNY